MNSYNEIFEYSLNPCMFETKVIGGRNFRVNEINKKYFSKNENNLLQIQKQLEVYDKSSSEEDSLIIEDDPDVDEDEYNKIDNTKIIEKDYNEKNYDNLQDKYNKNNKYEVNKNDLNKEKIPLKATDSEFKPQNKRENFVSFY